MFDLIASLVLVLVTPAPAQTIDTIAGGGPANGLPATSFACEASGVAASASGQSLYICCRSLNRVFRVDRDGAISLVAGNGTNGFSGDNGPAVYAQLDSPEGVGVDNAGNVYVADTRNDRVRKVTPAGIITTVAGGGGTGFFSGGFSGDGGPASAAQLSKPNSVAVDAGSNLYIADTYNNRVRRVAPSGTITTVAGNGNGGFSGDGPDATRTSLNFPNGIDVDATGALLIADSGNNRIRRVSPQGAIVTIAGNGARGSPAENATAASAPLNYPSGVAQNAGILYIADTLNQRVWQVSQAGLITTLAGGASKGFAGDGGPAGRSQIADPRGVAVDGSGDVYIADTGNFRVRRVRAGTILTVAGNGEGFYSGDNGTAKAAQFGGALDVAVDPAGNVYVADTGNHRVRKIAPDGFITTVAGTGKQGFAGDGGPATAAELSEPFGLAVDGNGLYIAETGNNRVRKVSPDGVISTVVGGSDVELAGPYGLTLDSKGNLYIADHNSNYIRKLASDGTLSIVAGTGSRGFSGDGGPAAAAQLRSPYGVAVDAADNLYIADTGNNRIRKVTADGMITTVAGNGGERSLGDGGSATDAQFSNPWDVAVDADGNVYVSDESANRIRKVTNSGIISTLAGNGTLNSSGDGGPAQASQVAYPAGLAVDSQGRLYIAEPGSGRIRVISP